MRVMKKAVVQSFVFAEVDVVIHTLEGAVSAKKGDAVVTGIKGERWPIRRPIFLETYNFDETTGTCSKKPIVVTATKMNEAFEVKVGWSDTPIQGKPGDYLLEYGPGDKGAVDAEIFAATYDVVEPTVRATEIAA